METSKKHRWKQALTILLAFAMICTTVSVPAYAADETSGTVASGSQTLTWNYDTNTKTLTLSGAATVPEVNESTAWGQYKGSITKVVFGEGVTEIAPDAFASYSALKSVDWGDVTTIGMSAFQSSGITEVKILDSNKIESIGSYAFMECQSLTSVEISSGVRSIETEAFYNCTALETVKIFDNTNEGINIGSRAFGTKGSISSALKSIVLPAKASIDQNMNSKAFQNCSVLEKIYFLGDIESNAFTVENVFWTKNKSATIYYDQNNASNLNEYLTRGKGKDSYKKGGYADLSIAADKQTQSKEYSTTELVTYTGTLDGVIAVREDVKWQDVSLQVKGYDSNNDLIASTDVSDNVSGENLPNITTHSINSTTKAVTVTVANLSKLNAGIYTFKLSVTEGTGENAKTYQIPTALTLTITPKHLGDRNGIVSPGTVNINLSNAGQEVNYPLPQPASAADGGKYSTEGITIKPNSESSAFQNTVTATVTDVDSAPTLKLTGQQVDDTLKNTRGVVYVQIPVTSTQNYEAYSLQLTVVIKKSPAPVSKEDIKATHNTITISSANSRCEYAYKQGNGEWNQRTTPTNGTVTFTGLKENTSYTVGVRYAAVGTKGAKGYVAPTLPSETEVTTLLSPPSESDYKIDYEKETIAPTAQGGSDYKISIKKGSKSDEGEYVTTEQTVTPDAAYTIKKTKDSAVSTLEIKVPNRPDAPEDAFSGVTITKTDTSITLTGNKNYLYRIMQSNAQDDESLTLWKDAQNLSGTSGTINFSNLSANTTYAIFARAGAVPNKDNPAFASKSESMPVTTKSASGTAPSIDNLFTDCDLSASGINVKKTAGCEYLLIPAKGSENMETYKKATGWTKVENAEENEILTLNQYCDNRGKMQPVVSGTKYKVLVRYYETEDTMASNIAASGPRAVLLAQLNAETVKAAITITYSDETVTIGETYEAFLADNETAPKNNDVANLSTGGSITSVIDATKKLYVRKKADTTMGTPASEWTAVTVTARPNAPAAPSVGNVTDISLTITNVQKAYEYLVTTDSSSETETWISGKTATEGSLTKGGLTADTAYTVRVRVAATETAPKSAEATTNVTTKTTQSAPKENTIKDMVSTSQNTATTIKVNGREGYQYILIPDKADASAVTEEKWTQNGATGAGMHLLNKTYNNTLLVPGTKYTLLVRLAGGEDKMPSPATKLGVCTLPEAPKPDTIINAENGITIDYVTEKVTLHGETYEVFVSADGKEPGTADATISRDNTTASITATINGNGKIYIRTKAGESGNPPASAWASIDVKGRTTQTSPESVANVPRDKVTNTTITIPSTNADCEYIVVKDGETISGSWTQGTGESIDFSGLEQDTTYKIYVRKKANSEENTPATNPAEPTTVKTKAKPTTAPDTNITNGMAGTAQNTDDKITVSGKKGYEYIVVPAGTTPGSITEEQWKAGGQKAEADGTIDFDKSYDQTNSSQKSLEQGTGYIVVVRKALDEDSMPSPAAASDTVYIKQPKPSADDAFKPSSEGGKTAVSIDYSEGKITINDNAYEVFIPTAGAAEPGYDTPATTPADGKIDITNIANNTTIYIRKKADTARNTPASDWTPVTIKVEIASDKTTVKAGETAKLTVKLSPADAGSGAVWKWESKNPEIATVDKATGALKAVKAGKVTVTATIVKGSGETATTGALAAETEITISAASSGGSGGGGSVIPPTSGGVTTTGSGSDKVTTASTEVKNETTTDASGKQETIAKITVSSANQRESINQAKTNKSKEIIIKVNEKDIKDGAKPELNLEKSFIDSIVNDTNASLRIIAPNGEKALSRSELAQLSKSADGSMITIALSETDEPENPSADDNTKLIKGVQKTTITLKSAKSKKGILLKWTKKKGYKVDYFEIYRSTKKNSGYGKKPFFRTKDGNVTKYLNTKNVKTGTSYYYKIRGVRVVDGKKYYTEYSNKAYRAAK